MTNATQTGAPEPLGREEVRDNFVYFETIPLRWIDNDLYGHLNNARYYSLFETTIMHYFMLQRLDPNAGECRCFTAENGCRYFAPVKFPDIVECGLRVAHIGNSSVRYELGLFVQGQEPVAATGHAVEIFVDAQSERPTRIPDDFRAGLQRLVVST